MQVVLATANAGKQRELAALLAPLNIELLLQSALGIEAIEETGTSFEANALLKARHAAARSGLAALADDSGLEVDALGGRPGVYSARYARLGASDAENNARLISELEQVGDAQRSARYRCVLVLVRSAADHAPLVAHGSWEGHIARQAAGTGGFGYDPWFIPLGCSCTVAQLSAEKKNALSHRAQALRQLIAGLGRWP
jgi:XTP/dITP diphosphohydrolase